MKLSKFIILSFVMLTLHKNYGAKCESCPTCPTLLGYLAYNHPQNIFCRSDFVVKANIVSRKENDSDSNTKYCLKDVKIFRSVKSVKKIIGNWTISTHGKGSPCHADLMDNKTYYFAGKIEGGEAFVDHCNQFEISYLPSAIKYGIENDIYGNTCGNCEVTNDASSKTTKKCTYSSGWFQGTAVCQLNDDDACSWNNIPSSYSTFNLKAQILQEMSIRSAWENLKISEDSNIINKTIVEQINQKHQ